MRKSIPPVFVGLLLIGLLVTSVAYAGSKWSYGFFCSRNADGSGSCSGTISEIRNSTGNGYLMCQANSYSTTGTKYSTCFAFDGASSYNCSTYDNNVWDAITRMQGDQYVEFIFNGMAQCTSIFTMTGSQLPPKAP